MTKNVFDLTTSIAYNSENVEIQAVSELESQNILYKEDYKVWLHSKTLEDKKGIKEIIENNYLDDFLNILITNETETNKVIELDDTLFISIYILSIEEDLLLAEPLTFIVSPNFIWSIQDNDNPYFDWLEKRILNKSNTILKKDPDYLLGLMIKTIIDSYDNVVDEYSKNYIYQTDVIDIRPSPEFMQEIEQFKQKLFVLKKSTLSLRDCITKIVNSESVELEEKYFNELKEQVKNVLNDIDFQIQTLESKISLLFSIQGHRLNEIMKTLTIFSVIFIPLTFIVGVYGMNFANMPELEWANGYYFSLLLMLAIVIIIIFYIKRRFL